MPKNWNLLSTLWVLWIATLHWSITRRNTRVSIQKVPDCTSFFKIKKNKCILVNVRVIWKGWSSQVDLEGSRINVDHHVICELNLDDLCCDFFNRLINMGHFGISWTFNGQVGILTVKWPLKGHGLMSFSNALIKIRTCLLGKQWEN